MAFNDDIIAEFRNNDGHVSTMGFGDSLVVLHTIGARSGRELLSPLMGLTGANGHRMVVGSGGGSPKHPGWVHNLRAIPQIIVEYRGDNGIETAQVIAREVDDDEWDAAWKVFTSRSRGFEEYARTAEGRKFPIFELVPAA